ncbi:MAG TPA: HdeD family acid-resistance protein [Gemmatimonadaceae bacterium]|nr:HdeD family acid-resistance protein [Gemmatimonadaceae bacterium]
MRVPIVDVDTLVRNWWVVLLRGVAAILFGILTFLYPGISLAALVLLFGAWAFVDGVLAVASAVRRRKVSDRWWVLLLEGLAGIAAGVLTVFWPGITALALLYVIAAWALVTGVLEVVAAIRLRRVITGEWLLALAGIASVVLGVLLVLFPGVGALAVVLWIGAYAIVAGALLVALGLRLRAWGRSRTTPEAAAGIA